MIFNIPAEFIVFTLTLIAIAFLHKRAMEAAIAGLIILICIKVFNGGFSFSDHLIGSEYHEGEWKILMNLFGLLVGFEALAKHFEDSGIPQHLPKYLPDDWKGGFVLLVIVFVFSSFLDNIAAAMIGGSIALIVFNRRVHLGFIAAIVAASNAGGSGSVLGDTTTTMMWISGISPILVLRAYIPAVIAFFCFSIIASKQQDRFQRIIKDEVRDYPFDITRIIIVAIMLLATIATNILFDFPALGLWVALILSSFARKIPWKEVRSSLKGSFFLLSLVLAASLMPVKELPNATWHSTFFLGFLSSVFDNIPLTRLALEQGGYDFAMLAYAIGFGGSMIWFGSSAGVAISNLYPESRSVFQWIKSGWHIAAAYVIGFFALYFLMGWNP